MKTIDLHMHSSCSMDGEFSPAELMRMSKAAGLSLVSLTDHNCVRGLDEAEKAAAELGLGFVRGVELDCRCKGTDLHLLGYGFSGGDDAVGRLEADLQRQNLDNGEARLRIIHEMGIHFDGDKVRALAAASNGGFIINEMIMNVALADPRNRNNPMLAPYFPGGPRCDNPSVNFYWDHCAQGKPGYLEYDLISFEEAQSLITSLGGFSVIAHPSVTVKQDEKLIAYMRDNGVTGLEVCSSYHSPDHVEYYRRLAERLDFVKTVGSDFHGKLKPGIKLATGGAVPEEPGLVDFILSRAS